MWNAVYIKCAPVDIIIPYGEKKSTDVTKL